MDICIDPQLLQRSLQFLPGELLHTLRTTQIEWTETRKENFQTRIMRGWTEGLSLEGIRREIEGVLSFCGEILEFVSSKEERERSRQFFQVENKLTLQLRNFQTHTGKSWELIVSNSWAY